MNGWVQAILAATPLAGIILYFTLSGQQQVRTDQQRSQVKQEINNAEFDRDFERMNADISGTTLSQEREEQHQQKIDALEAKAGQWDNTFDQQFEKMDGEMADLEKAMKEMQ